MRGSRRGISLSSISPPPVRLPSVTTRGIMAAGHPLASVVRETEAGENPPGTQKISPSKGISAPIPSGARLPPLSLRNDAAHNAPSKRPTSSSLGGPTEAVCHHSWSGVGLAADLDDRLVAGGTHAGRPSRRDAVVKRTISRSPMLPVAASLEHDVAPVGRLAQRVGRTRASDSGETDTTIVTQSRRRRQISRALGWMLDRY